MAGTVFLKLGTIILVLVFILHAVGFATPKWAIIDILGGLSSYHTGLWQNCFSVFGFGGCSGRAQDEAAWFRAAQVLESVGVLGLLICVIISLVLACSAREKSLKAINIIIMIGSAICIIVGVIVFAVELFNAFDDIFTNVDVANVVDDKLGYSFFLSTVAGGLCLLVCVPLFIIDYRAAATQPTQKLPVQYPNQSHVVVTSKYQPTQPLPVQSSSQSRVILASANQPTQPVPVHYPSQSRVILSSKNQPTQPVPVHYSNQSQVIISSKDQPQVMQSRNYQSYGNMPPYVQDRPVYYVTRHPSFERMPTHGVW